MTEPPPPAEQSGVSNKIHEPDSPAQYPSDPATHEPVTPFIESDAERGNVPANSYGPLRVGPAVGYAWESCKANLAAWVAASLAGFLGYLFFVLVVWLFDPSGIAAVLLLMLAMVMAALMFQSCLIRGALYELDGRKPRFTAFVYQLNLSGVFITACLVLVLVALGWMLCVLPGLAVGVLSVFAPHYVIDQRQRPVAAIRSSWILVLANLIPVTLLTLVNAIFFAVGLVTCGLGFLFALPVGALSTTYAYRQLTNGRVTPLWS